MSQETKPSLYGHIYFVDILRGWLILLVTYGHTIQAIYGGRETVFSDPVFQTIYMFHMPLFMAISGFVLCRVKFSYDRELVKRTRALLLPTLSWSLIYACLGIFGKHAPVGEPAVPILSQMTAIWYLPCLFLSWIAVAHCELLIRGFLLRVFAMIAISVAILFLPETNILPYVKFTFPFYCLGHCASAKREFFLKPRRWKKTLIGAAFAIFAFCFWAWKPDTYVDVSGSAPVAGNIENIMLRDLAALSGGLLFIAFVWAARHIGAGFMQKTGTSTIYIYVLQVFFFKLYAHFMPDRPALFLYALAPLISFALSFACMKIGEATKKTPFLAILLFGRSPAV